MHLPPLLRQGLALLLALCLNTFSQAAVYKCQYDGLTTYSDHLCQQAGTLSTPPLPTVPAFKAAPAPPSPSTPPRLPRAAGARSATTAHRQRCGLLAQQHRWAQEDLQAARSLAQPPGSGKVEQARRKLQRLEQRLRLQCPAP